MAGIPAEGARLSHYEVETAARQAVRRAVASMVTDAATRTLTSLRTTGRTWPGVNTIAPEPIAQIEAAHAMERAAHAIIKDLLRLAREAGRSWYEIGSALDLHAQAVAANEPVAEVAYNYALVYQPGRGMRTFTWTRAADQLITDQSPSCELPAQEEGHADDCARWAAELSECHRYNVSKAP